MVGPGILGKVDFQDPFTFAKRLGPAGKVAATRAHRQAGNLLLREVKRTAPADTGAYAASWRLGTADARFVRLRTSMPALFEILEFTGGRPHAIRPVRAKFLHWIDRRTGRDIFRRMVQHPGAPPTPHARPALKRMMYQTPGLFRRYLKEELRRKR